MKLALTHTLQLDIGTPPRAVQHLLLTGLNTPQQKIERWSIAMPGLAEAAMFRDGYGNRAHLVSQSKPEGPITVTVTGAVETTDKAGVLGRLEYDPGPGLFRRPTRRTEAQAELTDGLDAGFGRIALLHALMDRVHAGVASALATVQTMDGGSQSQVQTTTVPRSTMPAEGAAHAFIGAARGLDIPARYVTGYLVEESTAMFHGWAEAWDEGLGWIGFDPVYNLCPGETYVRLASALDAAGATPVRSVPALLAAPSESIDVEVAG